MSKSENQDAVTLFCLMGEALFRIQLLEDVLSHSITLKEYVRHPSNMSKLEASKILEKHRQYTLGKAVESSRQKGIYSVELQNELKDFLIERNWLVHKCIPYNIDDMHIHARRDTLFNKIKNISNRAKTLQRAIDDDLIDFSESVGIDMSNVRAAAKQYYAENLSPVVIEP